MNFVIRVLVYIGFEDISGISRTIRVFLSLQNFLKTPSSRDTDDLAISSLWYLDGTGGS